VSAGLVRWPLDRRKLDLTRQSRVCRRQAPFRLLPAYHSAMRRPLAGILQTGHMRDTRPK
jgi:hypothetical protein